MTWVNQMDDVLTNNFDDLVQTSYLKIISWTFSSSLIALHLLLDHHPCLEFEYFF